MCVCVCVLMTTDLSYGFIVQIVCNVITDICNRNENQRKQKKERKKIVSILSHTHIHRIDKFNGISCLYVISIVIKNEKKKKIGLRKAKHTKITENRFSFFLEFVQT